MESLGKNKLNSISSFIVRVPENDNVLGPIIYSIYSAAPNIDLQFIRDVENGSRIFRKLLNHLKNGPNSNRCRNHADNVTDAANGVVGAGYPTGSYTGDFVFHFQLFWDNAVDRPLFVWTACFLQVTAIENMLLLTTTGNEYFCEIFSPSVYVHECAIF